MKLHHILNGGWTWVDLMENRTKVSRKTKCLAARKVRRYLKNPKNW